MRRDLVEYCFEFARIDAVSLSITAFTMESASMSSKRGSR